MGDPSGDERFRIWVKETLARTDEYNAEEYAREAEAGGRRIEGIVGRKRGENIVQDPMAGPGSFPNTKGSGFGGFGALILLGLAILFVIGIFSSSSPPVPPPPEDKPARAEPFRPPLESESLPPPPPPLPTQTDGTGTPGSVVSSPPLVLRILSRIQPVYPPIAKQAHLEGEVYLSVKVSPDGSVLEVHSEGGNSILVRAAIEAVMKWRYQPFVDSSDEPIETHVKFDFKLDQ
jgi:TonB family protein